MRHAEAKPMPGVTLEGGAWLRFDARPEGVTLPGKLGETQEIVAMG